MHNLNRYRKLEDIFILLIFNRTELLHQLMFKVIETGGKKTY